MRRCRSELQPLAPQEQEGQDVAEVDPARVGLAPQPPEALQQQLVPPAAQSGISRPSQRIYRRSPIGATYDAFDSERYVLTFDNKAFRDVAANAPYEFVEILVNSATYGGGGIFGLYSTVAADSVWAPYIFVHEFGHHIAGLADEYYTSDVAYLPAADRVEPW